MALHFCSFPNVVATTLANKWDKFQMKFQCDFDWINAQYMLIQIIQFGIIIIRFQSEIIWTSMQEMWVKVKEFCGDAEIKWNQTS